MTVSRMKQAVCFYYYSCLEFEDRSEKEVVPEDNTRVHSNSSHLRFPAPEGDKYPPILSSDNDFDSYSEDNDDGGDDGAVD
eukprot:4776410-Ditylum_brightwellii.AAC.2